MSNTTAKTDPQLLQDLRSHHGPLAATEIALAERAATQPSNENLPAATTTDADETIANAAVRIRNLWGEVNAVEKFIAIGGVFRELRDHLGKRSRHDKEHLGWHRTFSGPERHSRFGCDRRVAEKAIRIFETFRHVGEIFPTCALPSSFSALASLAALNLTSAQLVRYVTAKKIGPNTTEREVTKLGIDLGLIKPRSKKSKPATQSASPIIPEVMWAYHHAPDKDRLDLLESIGVDEILKSQRLRTQIQERYEGQQRALGKKTAETRVLAARAAA